MPVGPQARIPAYRPRARLDRPNPVTGPDAAIGREPSMAAPFKPLFHKRSLENRLAPFGWVPTPEQRSIVEDWTRTVTDPAFRKENEKPFQGAFLADLFCGLLGYAGPAGHLDAYNLKAESASSETPGGRTPDARLGFIGRERDVTRVVVELKAPGTDLDGRQSGHGGLTPVEQAFGYLAKFDDCRWVIVSDFVSIRLYSKRRGQAYAHEFRLADLADPEALRRFVFLLGRRQLIAEPPADSAIDSLLSESCSEEEAISRTFYGHFSDLRAALYSCLVANNPAPAGIDPLVHSLRLLAAAQKVLDRILFICFCQASGLLPNGILGRIFDVSHMGFIVATLWEQLRHFFRAVDKGHAPMQIPGYNGGLFRHDPFLDSLVIPDAMIRKLQGLGRYDFTSELDVNILGHIFEQSIADLEAFRAEIRGESAAALTSKRKLSGVFYTPDFITRYLVAETIGAHLHRRFDDLLARHDPDAVRGPAARKAAWIAVWKDYWDVLRGLRVVDPACGSGAFLNAAYDYLRPEYERTSRNLAELQGGQADLFDVENAILADNLFGVDLNPESVEITKLSLWLKTARTGRLLVDLDGNIQCGNSLVSPSADLPAELADEAFDWRARFPGVFESGGFDCVIGNPPYIRQEWLAPYKAAFQREFRVFAGTADAYLYFFERGLELLRPGGMLGYISSGTFANAGFAAPFRAWLPTVARFTRIVNFGENQPFEDAEMVYPTVSVIEKDPAPKPFRTYFMRAGIPDSIADAVDNEGIDCDESVFRRPEWRFQPAAVSALLDRLMSVGRPLSDVVEGRIYRGVLTGLNDAFIVDQKTRDRLVAEDPGCAPILRRMLRGEDLRPWYQEDEGRWLIFARRGIDIAAFPSIQAHLEGFRARLEPRPEGWRGRPADWPGRKAGSYQWYEIQDSVDYYPAFDRPKILWPDIAKLPRFSWDATGLFTNDKCFLIDPGGPDPHLLPLLQNRLQWFCLSQICTPLRLRGGLWQFQCKKQFVERLRIPDATTDERAALSDLALRATDIARQRYDLDSRVRHRIVSDLADPGRDLDLALFRWWQLDFAAFRGHVEKALGRPIPVRERADWEGTLAGWRAEHERLTAMLAGIEAEIDDRVFRLFGLGSEDVAILAAHGRSAMIDYPYGQV